MGPTMMAISLVCLLVLPLLIASAERVRYLEVRENQPIGTRVGFVEADSPPYLVVPVPGSAADQDLTVDPATGEIRTRAVLDRETRATYSLIALPQNVRVVVQVLDENDNAPNFPAPSVDVEFPENAPSDARRALPPARDPDLGQYTTQHYEILPGSDSVPFRLVPHRGRDGVLYLDLQCTGVLDRENRDNYQLTVEALDGGNPPLRARFLVNVTVQDVNDNPPVFENTNYMVTIPENATVGSPVIQVRAHDADAGDNGRVEYSINRRQSDREEMFRVDPETGLVYVNKPLDFEAREHHELVLVARDRGAQTLEATAFLSVRVSDVNDNKPTISVIFLSEDATPKVREDARPGEFIARVSVTDPDSRAEYSNATVALSGGEGHFGLTVRDGAVYLVLAERSLDREEKSGFDLSLEATDTGNPPLRAVKSFHLLVTDVNDNRPRFEKDKFEVHLAEAAEIGTSLLRVSAYDADEGPNAQISYSIVGTQAFAVDQTSGLVSTATRIECEMDPNPTFTILATDAGRPALTGSATVRVTVHDVNDNEPIFEKPLYNVTLPEDLPQGRCFIKVRATDSDCGVNAMVNYTLGPEKRARELFFANSNTGEICIKSQLDREIAPYHELSVIATDRGGLSSYSILRITIIDINDNRPIFQPQEYNVTLRTDGGGVNYGGEPLLRVRAVDRDSGAFGQVSYKLTSGNDAGIFSIDRLSGELYVSRPSRLFVQDSAGGALHQLNVSATDAAGLSSLEDAVIKIRTIPTTLGLASCERSRYRFTVRESAAQNTFIGSVRYSNVTGSGAEKNFRYFPSSHESDLLLEPVTGSIRTRLSLDAELRNRYMLSVEAHNSISTGYCQVEIVVENVNDQLPVFLSSTSVRMSVPESHPLNAILYVAQAVDPDGGAVRYVLSQNGNEIFGIDGRLGQIFLVRSLDYEVQQRHRLMVTAVDESGASANLSLAIEVQDVNDNPPVFERNEYYVEVSEGTRIDSEIIQVMAVDLDSGNNAKLTYQLKGPPEFRISSSSGWIFLAKSLDRESADKFRLTVTVTDNGTPSSSTTTSVVVTVLDENDNDPKFGRDSYSFGILENRPAGTSIGQVTATDLDLGKNSQLRYSIVSGNNGSFLVDSNTGEIKSPAPLDREIGDAYELVLEVRDQGVPSRFTRVPVRIVVRDVNDNSPEIIDPQGDVISVREGQPATTEVARIRAVDNDLGENATVTFTIIEDRDSNGHSFFSIDPTTGVIKTKVVLDHEERSIYRLSVKASDAGQPPRHTIRTLRVEVLALADNRPTFASSSLTFKVREDAEIGSIVGSIYGSDSAGKVAYTINSLRPLNGHPAFDVDKITGQLVVARNLDRENITDYQLEIRALDTSALGNPQIMVFSVKIDVDDVNDNAPKWQDDDQPIVIEVSERMAPGAILRNLSATDADSGANGEIRYGLISEHPKSGSFAVDPLTGVLSLTRALDREEHAEFILVLKAEDRAGPKDRLSSTLTAKILVVDHNDNDPVFVVPEASRITVGSNIGPGMPIIRLIATDKDEGENGRVSYAVTSGNEDGRFTLDKESGVLQLARPLMRSTELEIVASDHGLPARKTSMRVSLVQAASSQNSGPPRLLLPNPIARLSENLRVGADVVNVASAAVAELGNVTFSIPNGGIVSETFTVLSSGMVRLRKPLDHETVDHYSVPILARSSKFFDLTILDIFVLDENDNHPEFKVGSCYTLAMLENQDTVPLHTITAHDPDEGKNGQVTYSIINGNIGSKFKLDPITGVLTSLSLDREVVSKYVLTIAAKDNGRPSLETLCNLTVSVIDVNDNSPKFSRNQYSDSQSDAEASDVPSTFSQGKYQTSISEDTPVDSSIMQVKATDPDEGINGKITYSIAEESSWLFKIDNLTGVISTAGSLDRERRSSYRFLVVATDGGKYNSRQTSVPVEIQLTDVNNDPPTFVEYPFRGQVPVDAQVGQSILRVKALDADEGPNGAVMYSFARNQENSHFRIHPNTGLVTLASSFERDDDGGVIRLEIEARDRGVPSLTGRGLVELRVGSIPKMAPVLQFQNDTYHASVSENTSPGTELMRVTAVRSDGRRQPVAYSIGAGNNAGIFAIDEETGTIKVADPKALDAEECCKDETKDEEHGYGFVLTLVAKGTDSLQAYAKLYVRILDVNDNAPIFTQSEYFATVLEGNAKGDFVIKLSASDADQGLNSRILYHIVDGNPDNAFTIDPPYSGVVRTNIALDREIHEKYRLTVIATDQGNPQLTGTTALSVRVIDVNDNQPTFPEHSVINIAEDTAPGLVLTTITANDVDSSPELTYWFGNVSHPGPFSIDRYGGRIVLRSPLDAEMRSEYTLQVVASDGIHETTTELTIRVIDLNDNPPIFERPVYIVALSEDRGSVQDFLTVNATDDDLTEENSSIQYRLYRPMKGFLINSLTGTLSVNKTALPKPLPREIELVVVARDSGKAALESMCAVVVRTNSLKRNKPYREYTVGVKENISRGASLMKLSDVDLLDGAIVAGDDAKTFEISRGKLVLVKPLDREVKDRYVLKIGANADKAETASLVEDDPITVVINVEDVNDNYPIFVQDLRQVTVKEDVPLGHVITTVGVEDEDLAGSPAATVVLEILSGNEEGNFRIDAPSSSLLVNASLDCDANTSLYNLVLIACDRDPVTPLCNLTSLAVLIEDVNDNSPKFPVTEYLEFVGENEPIGTSVFTARAFDLDHGIYGSLNYSIVSDSTDRYTDIADSWRLFSIDPKSGSIMTQAIFDYEQRNRYVFTVRATDVGGRTASVRVRVEVDSKDEFYPQFTERMYRFGVRMGAQLTAGTVIGYVTATDRDKGPDGRVVYQLTAQHPFLKMNRTTGALILKRKFGGAAGAGFEESSRLIVSASSGRQSSLSNMTVVEILFVDNDDLGTPNSINNIGANMAIASQNSVTDWAMGLFIALLLIVIVFGSIFLYMHIKNRRYKKPGAGNGNVHKSGLNKENNTTTSNSYVDTSAFDIIPIRSPPPVNNSRQFAPPKYDEIPPYGIAGRRQQQQQVMQQHSELGSSGRGSAEDDDEEIRMINENQSTKDVVAGDLAVQNTQEYLARLGIVEPPVGSTPRSNGSMPIDNMHLFQDELVSEADIATLIYGKIEDLSRPTSGLEIPGGPSMNGSLSSIVYSEEELTGSYNWDYLLDWGPQYQPLAHVFSEIARLKDDEASMRSGNSRTSSRSKAAQHHRPPPPPLLTNVAPRSSFIGGNSTMGRGMMHRSPISHDSSTYGAVLSPSFSPSLSPLANRSPSISPLVMPTAAPRTNQVAQ